MSVDNNKDGIQESENVENNISTPEVETTIEDVVEATTNSEVVEEKEEAPKVEGGGSSNRGSFRGKSGESSCCKGSN